MHHGILYYMRVILGFISLLLCAATASAQTAGYVGGSVFADIREFGSTGAVPYYGDQFSLDSTGLGGGLRIGTFLHPRWSLELAAEASSKTTVDLDDAVRILIFPPPILDFRASARFVTVTTTVGFHPPATGRVKLGYRAGFSFVSAIDLTPRIAVVPEVRALVFSAPNNGPGVFLIRPGVGVKWKF